MSKMAPSFRQVFAGIATGKRNLTKGQNQLMNDFVRELFGTQTGNGESQKVAKLWSELNGKLLDRLE